MFINEIWVLNYFCAISLSTDPLREINSYNHGLPDDNGQNNLEHSNNYHFKTSYEYEPHDNDNGVDVYQGNIGRNICYNQSDVYFFYSMVWNIELKTAFNF